MKKFNGHRCERRNLTDLLLDGAGPDGTKRQQPRAKNRPKNYTTEPAANKKQTGGPVRFEGSPGELPDFLRQYLNTQGGMNMASSVGQTAGSLISNMGDNASDPSSKYGVQEGLGAAISGATNPLAMTFGPVGMGVGALLGLGKSLFTHNKEKNEFNEMQREMKEERTSMNVDSAKSFSDQVLNTYDQQGVGGGLYARHGGPVDRFFYGGDTEPPAVLPGMEKYAEYAKLAESLNPELANAIANAPERVDRLYDYSDAEMRRNENMQRARVDRASLNKAKDVANNIVQYHIDKPLDALGMDLALFGQLPIIGEPADLINAGLSGTRAAYNTAVGDTAKAQEQAILASLSAASAIPFMGNVAGVGRVAKGADTVATGMSLGKAAHHVAHGAHDLERAVIAGKAAKAASYEGYEMGGPVDYETEKSEVILASPNDPPVAVGQGKYTQVSNNLYRAKGPSHKHGGIPTRGATQPFVDNTGTYNDSPYVFSDAKEMRFDPSEILSMIT